jgi:predicted GNAT family N-acyltransferase
MLNWREMTNLVLRIADLPAELPQVYHVRYQVFQLEQGVEPELEFDGKDEAATHFIAYCATEPVGTLRLRQIGPNTVKLERLAVVQAARGMGIGRQLMQKALEYLHAQQVTTVQIHAQIQVQDFYTKLGFIAVGDRFEEAGIQHIKMWKPLG